MAARKRTTLPKNFDELIKAGDIAGLKAVFDTTGLEARGGYSKATALGNGDLPDELVRWLVEAGADLEAADSYGQRPLHAHASSWKGNPALLLDLGAEREARTADGCTALHLAVFNSTNRAVLLSRGADPRALDAKGLTPLGRALTRANNMDITRLVPAARDLLDAGDLLTDQMRDDVARIGARFEEIRPGFNPEFVDETSSALTDLYELAAVTPAAARVMHDGTSPIVVTGSTSKERFDNLWQSLVRPSGPAATVQGEVIRIAGRLANEMLGNGGANWDADFRSMAAALPGYFSMGVPVAATGFRPDDHDAARELAIAWVVANPIPIPLPAPRYRR